MAKVGIFYGSTTGVTEDIANRIAEKIDGAEVFNIDGNVDELENYDVLLLGTSTWGFGDLQDDWQAVLDDLANLNLAGKKVAYFGSGDQGTFSDTFMDGMAIINEEISKTGATVIGNTSTEGYEFNESRAVEGDKFLGLALDEVNQSDLTDERIDAWVEQIKKEF
ncbi:MAG: flavodoxin [Leptotrichia sp.]|jgi:flavodoxin|uniref:Flavodoxin n=1 Tax=Leptotrichia rugosa TaxID=3239302 RepID=A0AB39VFL5_9FUSO|nr:flavodoxin [Leptotrichia sp. oral taxon 498]ASQ48179.1 flavodoxin [Leptotrichia sp. oral taxon 498]RKW35935.1 MAG: flavodoxin [Leptotrichia sp.]